MRSKNIYTWISILILVCIFFLYNYLQSPTYFVYHSTVYENGKNIENSRNTNDREIIEDSQNSKNTKGHIKDQESKISVMTSDGKKHDFDMLLADTPALQQKGLSGRTSLDDSQAMLFVFKDNKQHFFWMKDMLFPIDMVWLDEQKKVIYIEKGVAPETYPNSFGPYSPSRYVLEFNAGAVAKINLQMGDSVNF